MPEGPEIRRVADRLAAAVAGQTVLRAQFAFPHLKHFERALVGSRILSITPRGKALLTAFDNGWTLYTHNQLYGVWHVAGSGERPDTSRSLRVALETERASILLYSASDIELWRSNEIEAHPFLQGLGPDVLDMTLDEAAVAVRLQSPPFRGRALGALLLDQGFLAGMGNYLRAEVLFEAALSPLRRPADLDDNQRHRLAAALLAVPRHSYRSRGIAPARGMRSDHSSDAASAFRFRVFDREGQPCPCCGAAIVRETLAGRRLYACPACQA